MDFEEISELIYKQIIGSITEDEKHILAKWRESSASNNQLYNKLLSTSYLHSRYQKWRAIKNNSENSRLQMQQRIREDKRKHFVWLRYVAAVLVVGIFATLSYHLYDSNLKYKELLTKEQTEQYLSSIRHGETKATLTTDSGKKVVLGSSEESNEKAISTLKKESVQVTVKEIVADEDRLALNNLEIPRGGEFHIILEDSTEVWLNAESSLKYPEHFKSDIREVEVTGEAYFKVAKDSCRPFFVKTAGHRVMVYGTEFNIFSYDDEQFVHTTLVSGSISIQPNDNSNTELFLTPGHQAIFSKEDNSTFVQPIKTDVVTSWKDGMFVFENKTLEQIMRQLSRWYDFTYRFKEPKVAKTEFIGKIPRYGKFGDVLEILEKSGNLRFDVNKNEIMISNR